MATITLKTKKNAASAAGYIKTIKDPVRQADATLLLQMMKRVSGKKPMMWGSSLIGFGEIPYKRANGDIGTWFKIGFAARTSALSLYLTCDLRDFSTQLKKLGPHTKGVGCLYIKRLADIDMKTLENLIRAAFTQKPKWART